MNTYSIDLTYPRGTRQPVYSITLEAASQSQAIACAKMAASYDGWKGEPIKAKAVAV